MFEFFKWGRGYLLWAWLGTIALLGSVWYKVELDVQINEWFGTFYNTVQAALADPNAVTLSQFYGELATFGWIAGIYIAFAVFVDFFTKHYIFRWRQSMNDYYTSPEVWQKARHIEGASQRVQEDTRIFAHIMEGLGLGFVRSVLTLVAFLPILYGLGAHVTELPFVGDLFGQYSLITATVFWSLIGTVGLAVLGIKLPGLQYNNQKREAAYRKELVLGEDDEERAKPPSVKELFSNVRTNYFKLFFHYLYFDIGKWSYLQVGVIVPYILLAPVIVVAGFTLGVMQQVIRAFGRVTDSFQFLVNSWTTIVELLSVFKRLREFEKEINKDAEGK